MIDDGISITKFANQGEQAESNDMTYKIICGDISIFLDYILLVIISVNAVPSETKDQQFQLQLNIILLHFLSSSRQRLR